MTGSPNLPVFADIEAAHQRIAPFVLRTPILNSRALDDLAGCRVLFKCENLQPIGAFKIRGASNAVLQLETAADASVATHSSGNHAAALAWAAAARGIRATVVMPVNAPASKRDQVVRLGATIVDCEATLRAREATLAQVIASSGAVEIHPYDNADVIAGQGTAALEFVEDANETMTRMLVPIGGGGLASGTALAMASTCPAIKVIACEPAQADDAARSLAAGRLIPIEAPDTIADGLRTSLGRRPFALLQRHLHNIVTVEESDIINAMRLLWTHLRVLVEPSAAVPFAALLSGRIDPDSGPIGIILSGGNVDLDVLPWQGARA